MSNIPPPPLVKPNLFLPLSFWSEIMVHLDKKVETVIKHYGYGKIGMQIKIHKSEIIEVAFSDDISVRGLVEKARNNTQTT